MYDAFRTKFATDLQNSTFRTSNHLETMCLKFFLVWDIDKRTSDSCRAWKTHTGVVWVCYLDKSPTVKFLDFCWPCYFLLLKKATRALNGRALPFCVQMVQIVGIPYMYATFIYLIYIILFFIVSVQMWVLVLCFLFIFLDFSKYALYFSWIYLPHAEL